MNYNASSEKSPELKGQSSLAAVSSQEQEVDLQREEDGGPAAGAGEPGTVEANEHDENDQEVQSRTRKISALHGDISANDIYLDPKSPEQNKDHGDGQPRNAEANAMNLANAINSQHSI